MGLGKRGADRCAGGQGHGQTRFRDRADRVSAPRGRGLLL